MGTLCLGSIVKAQTAAPATVKSPEIIAPVDLRGYGEVSGKVSRTKNVSTLEITCESEAKARLLQAKYLSDLVELPGVTPKTGADGATIQVVANQGAIAAFCAGSKVTILASPDEAQLQALLLKAAPTGSSTAQVEVPMYLDRWDKFGFRFYYWPFHLPPGVAAKDYDFTHDFDYAEQQHRTGYVFWDNSNQMDLGEGMQLRSVWDWALAAADARHLPIAINGGSGFDHDGFVFFNKYPKAQQRRMPEYCGTYRSVASSYDGTTGTFSWNDLPDFDRSMGQVQNSYRELAKIPSVVSFLEPHGEMYHSSGDILMEYGPVADANYRKWLEAHYGSTAALNQRWYGETAPIRSWNDVHVPELASFAGWGPNAVDLTGTWAVNYELSPGKAALGPDDLHPGALSGQPIASQPAPDEWFTPGFDDSSWPRVQAPGSDTAMFIPHRPAVYRRTFRMDGSLRAAHPKWWLYVWDLNTVQPGAVRAYLNGKKFEDDSKSAWFHWVAFDVTAALQDGDNQLSLRLPEGVLGYRIYLSPVEPRQYPDLGPGLNAQWADLIDWTNDTRVHQVSRGVQMIRQFEPNRQITLMAPNHYCDGIRALAPKFGCEFHETGFMGGNYCDFLPSIMRGVDLPFSVELGGPADSLESFKRTMGLYLTESTQAVDYFIHEGDILYHDDIRKEFEANGNLYHLFGKFHAPKGNVAVLFNTRDESLSCYPWNNDPNTNLQSGYFPWNISAILRGHYDYDDLTESSFTDGSADAYKVIIDSNSTIIDPPLLAAIEKWIRNGGTFITSGQTGRHTSTGFNAWPISSLSGYETTHVDLLDSQGGPQETRSLQPVSGQDTFPESDWKGVAANGLSLQKTVGDCRDLMRWDDGSVAVGSRQLGKGQVIEVGCKFGAGPPDRLEYASNQDDFRHLADLYSALLKTLDVTPAPVTPQAPGTYSRHYISNNGLYDIWTIYNENQSPQKSGLIMDAAYQPTNATDIATGQPVALGRAHGQVTIPNLALESNESHAYLTPRGRITDAPRDWFELQRHWWRGTEKPITDKFPAPETMQQHTLDLTRDWAIRPVKDGEDITPLVAEKADDSSWPACGSGHGASTDLPASTMRSFGKRSASPWNGPAAKSYFSCRTGILGRFTTRAQFTSTARPSPPTSNLASPGIRLDLAPGSQHTLAVDIQGMGVLNGDTGMCWLSWIPAPIATQDLAGTWNATHDGVHYDAQLTFPGAYDGYLARTTATIDAQHAGDNVLVHFKGSNQVNGVMINGHWFRGDHHYIANEWLINITPWVKFGAKNEIQIGSVMGPAAGPVQSISLDYYDPAVYP